MRLCPYLTKKETSHQDGTLLCSNKIVFNLLSIHKLAGRTPTSGYSAAWEPPLLNLRIDS
jgi:hypothetical protein